MSRARDKEKRKNLSPRRKLNLWPFVQRSDALTTELRRTRDVAILQMGPLLRLGPNVIADGTVGSSYDTCTFHRPKHVYAQEHKLFLLLLSHWRALRK